METDPDHRNLPAIPPGNTLSVGAVALGLQIAVRNALTPEEAKVAAAELSSLVGYSEECVRLAFKKPPGWHYRLFLQVLIENIRRFKDRTTLSIPDKWDTSAATKWMIDGVKECHSLQEAVNRTLDTALVRAIGNTSGEASETAIVYLAIQVSEVLCSYSMIYQNALVIQLKYGSQQPFWGSFVAFCEQCILEFRQYPDDALNSVMNSLTSGKNDLQTAIRMDLPVLRLGCHYNSLSILFNEAIGSR